MLNTSPINGTTFSDYAKFLMNRYIKPEFNRGAQKIHWKDGLSPLDQHKLWIEDINIGQGSLRE